MKSKEKGGKKGTSRTLSGDLKVRIVQGTLKKKRL